MSPWPVALAGTLSSPVLDSVSGRIMVGSQNGILYAVNSSTGAVVGTSSQLGFDANGIYDPAGGFQRGYGLRVRRLRRRLKQHLQRR